MDDQNQNKFNIKVEEPNRVSNSQNQPQKTGFNLNTHPQEMPAEQERRKSKKRLLLFIAMLMVCSGLLVGYFYFDLGSGDVFQGRFFDRPTREVDVYTSEPESKVVSGEVSVKPAVKPGVGSSSGECFSESLYKDPKTPVKRKHFAAMLVDAAGVSLGTPKEAPKDMASADPCYKYVTALVADGALKPYFDGSVKPDQEIARFDVAIWVVKAFELPFILKEDGSTFADVPANTTYSPYVEVLEAWGATFTPRGETAFMPKESAKYDWAEAVIKVIKLVKSNSRVL
ncbi:MAG: S-layer homology domain-containing protein [Patescibacteria group bacterium]|nr:S-layer homology domain-containing protein [Patescibacteria group bacterium]